MTRQELIEKLFTWYCEWLESQSLKKDEKYDKEYYVHQEKRNLEMKKDKMKRLNIMTHEGLKKLYVMELIRREGYVEDES